MFNSAVDISILLLACAVLYTEVRQCIHLSPIPALKFKICCIHSFMLKQNTIAHRFFISKKVKCAFFLARLQRKKYCNKQTNKKSENASKKIPVSLFKQRNLIYKSSSKQLSIFRDESCSSSPQCSASPCHNLRIQIPFQFQIYIF